MSLNTQVNINNPPSVLGSVTPQGAINPIMIQKPAGLEADTLTLNQVQQNAIPQINQQMVPYPAQVAIPQQSLAAQTAQVPSCHEINIIMPKAKKSFFKGISSLCIPGLGQLFDGRIKDSIKFCAKDVLTALGAYAGVNLMKFDNKSVKIISSLFACLCTILNFKNRGKAFNNAYNSEQLSQARQIEIVKKQAEQTAIANNPV